MHKLIHIRRATLSDTEALVDLARITFQESPRHSASKKDITDYIAINYSVAVFQDELKDDANEYHLLFYKEELVGYSKLVFNTPITNGTDIKSTKLDRIYLLEAFHGLRLGAELFQFNIALAKSNDQTGIWLFTWKENTRALRFYEKMGFVIVGEHDFRISATHTNPNWQMLLEF